MNPLDISQMKNEATELNLKGSVIDKNSIAFSNSLDNFRISNSIAKIDISELPHKPHPKVDSKGRIYGHIVKCEECGATNVTLYNVNNKKICKKCKKGEK